MDASGQSPDIAARTKLTKGFLSHVERDGRAAVRPQLTGLPGAGNSVTFGAGVPHTWRNVSTTAGARLRWILAPVLPDPRSAG